MLLPLKLVCKAEKARRDGTSIVYIQYCYSSTERTLLDTSVVIPARYWNQKKQCIAEDLPAAYGTVDQLHDKLKRLKRVAEDIVDFATKKKHSCNSPLCERKFFS